MKTKQLSSLLGRTLTDTEAKKYSAAFLFLEELLCTSLTGAFEKRTFDVREGYSTVFTDLFREIESVKVGARELKADEFTPYQWSNRRGNWFNSIVLKRAYGEEVTIEAEWGFRCLPADLIQLLDRLVVQQGKRSNGNVKSKKIEDFSITYSDIPALDQFILDNRVTINKYSLCGVGETQSGRVCHVI